jgi:hypothetical protein
LDLSFYPLTLEALEQASADSLCLFVGEDERPLTGLAGLADWRLAGGLSRWLRSGLLAGTAGEAVLMPIPALGFPRLFLFGLGPSSQTDEQVVARTADCMRRLQLAGVESVALQLPARLQPEMGIRTLIEQRAAPLRALVFAADPAALVSALSRAASSGPAEVKHERRVIKVELPARPQASPPKAWPAVRSFPPQVPVAPPLPFATSSARGQGGVAEQGKRDGLRPEQARPARPEPAARAEREGPTPVDDVPIAPPAPDSEPPLAPGQPPAAKEAPAQASPDGAGTSPVPATTAAPAAVSASPATTTTSLPPMLGAGRKTSSPGLPAAAAGRVPLPVDHQAPRYKPPPENGSRRGKKKRR